MSVMATTEDISDTLADSASENSEGLLTAGLLGWYAVCSSSSLKKEEIYNLSMYNEPIILYRDNKGRARCIKDLCPHRGSSFMGGSIQDGELVCPYHGGRFSSEGECTNLDRLTCQHIIDSNYNNYAKRIHLSQYPCVERDGYIYIYYNGKAKDELGEWNSEDKLVDHIPDTFGFKIDEYKCEEVTVDFKCDWARIIENHLDILHIFWIHGDTIPDSNVNRKTITSFDQKITKDFRHIESKYMHKSDSKDEFITLKFIPPGRVLIYKGSPETARYIQVLDHIPLAQNRARVIVRHYRKFLTNEFLAKLVMFKPLQHRIFYRIFSEDYLVLKTQTYNQQMGYVEKDNVKLLGEDKMIQYFWDWHRKATVNDSPWSLHPTTSTTNTVHMDFPMPYPPENPKLAKDNEKSILINSIIRIIPIPLLILLIVL